MSWLSTRCSRLKRSSFRRELADSSRMPGRAPSRGCPGTGLFTTGSGMKTRGCKRLIWRALQDSNLRPPGSWEFERRQPGAAGDRCPNVYGLLFTPEATRECLEPPRIVSRLSVRMGHLRLSGTSPEGRRQFAMQRLSARLSGRGARGEGGGIHAGVLHHGMGLESSDHRPVSASRRASASSGIASNSTFSGYRSSPG
jgi:hypothetical protein